ncbi:DUF6199 family natural product biosynthesis protein [Nakamurella sp. A5-74]|uniref:DUF6199 family natural product biosynthesis protein n=1 Tax=Nakamurella sp. A5-74 TaxID=3158264 RepID=A0AAU8DWN9_9ACTN
MILELLAVRSSGGGDGNGSPWLVFIVAPLFIILGIALAIKPELQWKMNRWAYKNPKAMEPSAKGLVVTRVSGAGMVIVATIAIIVAATQG